MWSKLHTAIKNPFDLRHFYLLFLATVVLLLIPTIIVGLISKDLVQCKPFQLKFHGDLGSGKGKVYQFSYSGPNSCKLKISPDNIASEKMSLWIYKPDKSIDVVDLSTLDGNGGSVVTKGKNGTYKLSVRNNDSLSTEYQLIVSVVSR